MGMLTTSEANPQPAQMADRRDIFERDEHRCVYCAEVFDETELTVDHV